MNTRTKKKPRAIHPFINAAMWNSPPEQQEQYCLENQNHGFAGKQSRHHFYSREREESVRESAISYRQQKNEVWRVRWVHGWHAWLDLGLLLKLLHFLDNRETHTVLLCKKQKQTKCCFNHRAPKHAGWKLANKEEKAQQMNLEFSQVGSIWQKKLRGIQTPRPPLLFFFLKEKNKISPACWRAHDHSACCTFDTHWPTTACLHARNTQWIL